MAPDLGSANLKKLLILLLVFSNILEICYSAFVPPAATVEPLHPRGLRISIPDEDGITLVAYHVKFNDEFYSLEAGTIAVDIIKKRNGRWLYEDRTTRLKLGDTIYYWVHVVYDGLGYNLLDQQHVVKEFYNYDGTLANAPVFDDREGCPKISETLLVDSNGAQRHPCAGDLIFEENFDTLNTSRWFILEQYADLPNYEFVVYKNCSEIVNVKDGVLHIKPMLTDDKYGAGFSRQGSLHLTKCTGKPSSHDCERDAFGSYILPPVISGRLNTKKDFNFEYGRIEIRAKLPRGDWIYPLLSLENDNYVGQESGSRHEIRVATVSGNVNLQTPNGTDISGRVLFGGGLSMILSHNQVQHSNRMSLPSKISNAFWFNEYHTYEVEWRRGEISVKVDGNSYGVHAASSFDKPFYITLGLAVGGYGEFPDMSTSGSTVKPWRNVGSKALFNFYTDRDAWYSTWQNQDNGLHVDHIKVWAL